MNYVSVVQGIWISYIILLILEAFQHLLNYSSSKQTNEHSFPRNLNPLTDKSLAPLYYCLSSDSKVKSCQKYRRFINSIEEE